MNNSFTDIYLTAFKNYTQQQFAFTHRIVGIYGNNGAGKTNLLDAVYYLCFTKSYFNRPDAKNVRCGATGFRIEGRLSNATTITVVLRETGKKEVAENGALYKRMSAHVGKYPCVMIAPDDVQLLLGGSEERRRWIDAVLAQTDPAYMAGLISYNKVLQQRNSLLKHAAHEPYFDEALLEVFDAQLIIHGEQLYKKREAFFKAIIPLINAQNRVLTGSRDNIQIVYASQLQQAENFATQLLHARSQDRLVQRTGVGIHKDDVVFLLDEQPFKIMASQGQRKSLLFALKLAEYIFLQENLHKPPFLLLDDVFEKLDQLRMDNLLHFIATHTESQVFITDTHKDRLQKAFEKIGAEYVLIGL